MQGPTPDDIITGVKFGGMGIPVLPSPLNVHSDMSEGPVGCWSPPSQAYSHFEANSMRNLEVKLGEEWPGYSHGVVYASKASIFDGCLWFLPWLLAVAAVSFTGGRAVGSRGLAPKQLLGRWANSFGHAEASVSASDWITLSEFDKDIVRALDAQEGLGVVTYRCRPGDDCNGLGDRLAGVFGAAFVAISTRRTLKIDWPELMEVLQPNLIDWTFRPDELHVSKFDQQHLANVNIDDSLGPAFPDPAFSKLSSDVVVLNANEAYPGFGRYWRGINRKVEQNFTNNRIVIFSGNRGGTEDWYGELSAERQWMAPPIVRGWMDIYRAMFHALFVVNEAFMAAVVPMQQVMTGTGFGAIRRSAPTLRELVATLMSPDTFSIGVHIRQGDEVIAGEATSATASCDKLAPLPVLLKRLQCVESLMASHDQAARRRVLVIFSDSHCVKQRALEHLSSSTSFTDIWTQELSGGVNMDHDLSNDRNHAWRQSMRDWILMRYVSMYIIGGVYFSGFPASAIVTTSMDKEVYDIDKCTPFDKRNKDFIVCSSRFC